MGRTRDPYVITLKYPAKCAETDKAMAKGEQAVYYPTGGKGKNLFSMDSKQAEDFRSWKQDLAMGNDY